MDIYWIYMDIFGYLRWISFSGYVSKRYPESQKISNDIQAYPMISNDIQRYPKISKGANSQMDTAIWILATYYIVGHIVPTIFLDIVGHDIVCTTYDVVGPTS